MMISKKLKFATFTYDEEKKEFIVNGLTLNKTYAFAFTRFVLRIAQREFRRKWKNTK